MSGDGVRAQMGARDRRDDLVLGCPGDVEGPGRTPEAQHEDAVGDLEHVGEVVADHQHAETAFAQLLIGRSTWAVWATPRAAVG